MRNILFILVLLEFFHECLSNKEDQYMKLRGIVQIRKQATVNQYRNQEIKSKTYHDQIIKKIQVIKEVRDEIFAEWQKPKQKLLILKQVTIHIETLMSLLRHHDALFENRQFMEGILFNQNELEKLSTQFGELIFEQDDWERTHKEIVNLKYFEKLQEPNSQQLIQIHHQLQRIVNFFQPYEKEQENLRLHYSTTLSGRTQEIKDLLEQLELNQDAIEIDQYELDKQLLLHNYEIDLIDDELIQLGKKGEKKDL